MIKIKVQSQDWKLIENLYKTEHLNSLLSFIILDKAWLDRMHRNS